jgi:peptidyl-prolyl cis-trans isomerase D
MLSDSIHERMKGWFARILLLLIIVSFALFGVDAYFKGGGGQWVAEVEKQKISSLELDELVKQEQARLRALGEKDTAKLESKELKQRVLDQLIRERLLIQTALARGYDVSDEALAPVVMNNPNFQENGKFSEPLFERFLARQGMSRPQFFQSLKREALVNSMMGVPLASAFVAKSSADHVAHLMTEQREVGKATIAAEQFLPKVQLEESAIEAYYKAHPEVSAVPEQAKVEYLVFSPQALASNVTVSEEERKAYYEQHLAQFATAEQRELAHILIRVPPEASASEREALETKAKEVLSKAQAAPGQFGVLAKQISQDPVTAGKGGDLGFLAPGSVFPTVEKAAFEMKAGEIRGPIQSPAGYHILLLKSVKPASQRAYVEVSDLVAEGARQALALRRFHEEADKFGDLVYAQFSSLEPAAKQYKLNAQTSDWIGRAGGGGPLQNEQLLRAIFSDEAIKQKRNTEAIEVAPNTLVAARIVEYKPAGQKSFAEVRNDIEKILRREQAAKLAAEQGQQDLAALRQGRQAAGIGFGAALKVDRQNAQGLTEAELQAVFRAPVKTLPAYIGVPNADGYTLFRISKVESASGTQAETAQMATALMQRSYASLLAAAYVESLKQQAAIHVRNDVLEKAER